LAFPSEALAQTRFTSASFGVHLGLSLLGLVMAIVLLIEAIGVRRLAMGGLVAQRIGLVVLAVVCLSASSLAEWATNFVDGLTLDQTQLASQVLVIVAMGLLGAYFWNVRSGMRSYLTTAEEPSAQAPDELDDIG
jgi:hypothetical protein